MDEMTYSIRYWHPLERAFDRMRRILFEPFNFVKWMVLGFSAWLAGIPSGSSGSANFGGAPSDVADAIGNTASSLFGNMFLLGFLGVTGGLVLILIVLWLWLSSRGKFIFLDNVVNDRAEITDPWCRFKRLGYSLFLWRVAFVGIIIAVVLAGVLIPAIPAALLSGGSFEDLSIFAAVSWGIFSGLIVFAAVAVFLFIRLFLNAFVVPIMYRFDLSATEAWKNLVPWLKARPGQFILYPLFVLFLAIGLGMISMLVCLLTCCIVSIPIVGGGVRAVILLPLWVTYRCFSLEWLAQFDPGFDVFVPLVMPDDNEAIVVAESEV
jgi:hypothetical protein